MAPREEQGSSGTGLEEKITSVRRTKREVERRRGERKERREAK